MRWILNLGKNPQKGEGYAYQTAKIRCARIDQFYRFVWNTEDRYTTTVTHDHADAYMKQLAYGDTSQENKASHQKTTKMLFRWRAWEFSDEEWEPEITFSGDNSTTNPRDYLTIEERQMVREAALEYGSIPSYRGLSPQERDQWKAHLAQRFGKPKNEITRDDFNRANSWKIPSLVWVCLDTGLRPIEVERATIHWVDLDNRVLRIPKEESSKNSDNWIVSLTDRTVSALSRWVAERDQYEKYDSEDALWLTREATTYQSYSLNHILDRLCDIAGISTNGRKVTWYSIRHSVGTYMSREEGLAAAQAQLRHKSEQTTMRYDQTPVEDRRDALNKMG
ncbi:XerC/D-like integrase [Halococcus saccharolyticus DSM 5350]|uniref:XerC/D-like integrase n=2 Tax=Halococcus saccharolyticus TaxID=62319 RepID=M0MCN8_9EURY|nr:XerC/D-like integrase [Halococcus saccharolyticus DSM 5350]